MAIEEINASPDLLPDTELISVLGDTKRDASRALIIAFNMALNGESGR